MDPLSWENRVGVKSMTPRRKIDAMAPAPPPVSPRARAADPDLDLHLVEAPPDRDRLVLLAARARREGDHLLLAAASRRLADDLRDQGRGNAAIEAYREWLTAHAGAAPPVEVAIVRYRLASLLARANSSDEARDHVRAADEILGPTPPLPAAVCRLLATAWLAIQDDREPAALEPARRALDLALAENWPGAAADARQCLGIASSVAGRPDEALDLLFDAYSFQHARDRRPRMLELLSNLGIVSLLSGHVESAHNYLRRAAAIGAGESGARAGAVLLNLGIVNMAMGKWDEAEANLRESIRVHEASGSRRATVDPLISLARLCVFRRRFREAAGICAEAERAAGEVNDRIRGWLEAVAGELAMARGEHEAALRHFDALVGWLDRDNPRNAAGAFRRRAEAHLALARLDPAAADAALALSAARTAGDRVEEGLTHRVLADLAIEREDLDRAATEIHRSVDLLRAAGRQSELPHSLLRLAELEVRSAAMPIEDVLVVLAEAERIFAELGLALGVARCQLVRARLQIRAGMLDRARAMLDRARPVLAAEGLSSDRQRMNEEANALARAAERASADEPGRAAGLRVAAASVSGGRRPGSSPGRDAERTTLLSGTFIAQSPAMLEVLEQVERLGSSDVPVLILGETGVGKERVARAIHAAGPRRSGTFVPLIPTGLGQELLESQLFGHTRGAFTGADRERKGLLKAADGGTFFLDEVGEMPLPVQVSFLRFLETGDFRRIGESAMSRADIRVISATNRDLKEDVRAGRFRRDLYYRLATVVIELKPLRERIEDIGLLLDHFLHAYAAAAGKPQLRFSPAAREACLSYPWPGNVRELENEVRRVVALAGGHREVGLDLLSADLAASAGRRTDAAEHLALDEELSRLERRRIIQALMDADWNQSAAAAALGLKRTTLIARMRRHGIVR